VYFIKHFGSAIRARERKKQALSAETAERNEQKYAVRSKPVFDIGVLRNGTDMDLWQRRAVRIRDNEWPRAS